MSCQQHYWALRPAFLRVDSSELVLQAAEDRRGSPHQSLITGTENDEPHPKRMKQADGPPNGVDHAKTRKILDQKNLAPTSIHPRLAKQDQGKSVLLQSQRIQLEKWLRQVIQCMLLSLW